jgi:hypothetical protein
MALGYLVPVANTLQVFTDQGIIGSGYKLYTYVAGTTTPVVTYTTSGLTVANSNPVVLQSNGRLPNAIWVPSGTSLKICLTDTTGTVISGGTFDNLTGINDPAAIAITASQVSGLAASATTDTTNASNITSGTLPAARITALNGVQFTGWAATTPYAVAFSATAMTIDCSQSNVFTTTFTANVTVAPTLTNPKDGQTINWFITQDSTGSRLITGFWPASFKWVGASAGVLSTAANSVDILVATYRASTSSWYCTLLKNFA